MTLDRALKEARRNGLSAVAANRLARLAREFASPEAFFASPKGTVLSAWRRMYPDGKRDLGGRFWRDFDAVRLLLSADDPGDGRKADRTLSLADLKSVVDFMELTGMKRISVEEALSVLDTVEKGRR